MKIGLMALGLILIASAAWAMGSMNGTWRYKMIVEVETPEGLKTGEAVREITASVPRLDLNWPHATNQRDVKGEAVVVDLGKRGVLFGLIDWASYREVTETFPFKSQERGAWLKYYESLEPGTSKPLPKEKWPMFVTFTDMDDPKSVVLVRGGRFNKETQKYDPVNDTEELFGEGVSIKEITIEITDEPIVWKMENYLGQRHAVGPYEFVRGESK